MTAQQTLDAAQSLYDQHLISYPRIEARVITGEIAKTVAQRLHGLSVGSYSASFPAIVELSNDGVGKLGLE